MPRVARVVLPNVPHHITHRGVQQREVFFQPDDYRLYYRLLKHYSLTEEVQIYAYCLMPNHVHLIVTPSQSESLSRLVGIVHRQYAFEINRRENWSGHLWQDRYYSVPMDERHALTAVRYVELNPVRAKLVVNPFEYPYSSAAGHAGKREEVLLRSSVWLPGKEEWEELLASGLDEKEMDLLRRHTRRGVPLGKFSR